MFLYRKSYGSGLWITGPRLALGPWWTRDHGVAQPLQGSGGHRDSSEREREDVVEVLTNGTTCRRPMVLRWGDCFGREEERLKLGWVWWIMAVL
jgi:hypothetical protein